MSTPRLGHGPIAMRQVGNDPLQRRGDFYWKVWGDGTRELILGIPIADYGPRTDRYTPTGWTIDHKNHRGAQWSWDGNEDAPTLLPSLHAVGIWHGWVTAGQLVEA